MSKTETATKTRKPRARASQIVLATMDERLLIIQDAAPDSMTPHIARLAELLDELKRSLNGKDTDGE